MIDHHIINRIHQKLDSIEKEHNVEILFAIESGSRAWGFASLDSDYDVRFIYRHPVTWYLDVIPRRDVIEYPIVDEMDYSGWDLRKMFFLLNKSNSVLFEWFHSPIQYRRNEEFLQYMKEPFEKFFSPVATIYHYLHMAENNYREYLKSDLVKIKKYFYVLRPLLACYWIEKYRSIPPIEFEELFKAVNIDAELHAIITDLLERKRKGYEPEKEKRIDLLNDYIEKSIVRFQKVAKEYIPTEKPGVDYLNQKFSDFVTGYYLKNQSTF